MLVLSLFNVEDNLSAQNHTNHWYFGEKAGLLFDLQNDPQVLTNGAMIAPSACATISDKDGNLLFYTNGTNVWNRNHRIMQNGVLTGTLGMGGPIITEPPVLLNTIIIPITDSVGMYYIFTITTADGLRYSIVDMGSDGGLGGVVLKNEALLNRPDVGKLTAVHHADGKSIWLLTTRKNQNDEFTSFYAYKIEENGDIESPVITDGLGYKGLQVGQMKFSPNGQKIACANYRPESLSDHLTVFDFNPENGVVSSKRDFLTSFTFFEIVSAYGVEFSNDSKYLYASLVRQGMFGDPPDEIKKNLLYQYDIANMNPQQYSTSLHEENNGFAAGNLQLAKNGKIYRALTISENIGTSFLGQVNHPEILGVRANYEHNSVNLVSGKSRLGLPTFIQSYFRTRIIAENVCIGEPIPMSVDTYGEITEAQWDFGDGNTSNDITPQHIYAAPGNYEVQVTITVNNCPITVAKDIRVYRIPSLIEDQELVQCDVDTDGISLFNLNTIRDKITDSLFNEDLLFFESRENAELNIQSISNPESYTNTEPNQEIFVRVTNENGCFEITSFVVSAVFIDLGDIADMYACDDSNIASEDGLGIFSIGFKKEDIRNEFNLDASTSLKYYPTLNDALTQSNEIRERFFTSETTTIWVRAQEEDLACSGISSINLIVNPFPKIDIENEYLICKNQPIVLSGDITNDRYEWINGASGEIISTQRELSLSEVGAYQHIAYKFENGIECSNSKGFIINRTERPSFTRIGVNKLFKNSHVIEIEIDGSSSYEFSMDNITYFEGQGSYSFENIPAGKHTIYVRDVNQCEPTVEEDVYILGYPSFFTPNNDGVNDFWTVLGLPENELESIIIKIYDRFGKLISYLNETNNYSWDGTYNGNLVPQNDYWYEAIFKDGSIDRGHFTLKR
ncbi:T9SS type B sorting domain-containing protein [Hyunsoonleella ulvae]|uniref:T9SS type B sorting domain-containing protein n=1 Tax=Hyunsoonleella ulvae TaxID=2799948 RepID=UPI00193ADCB8|nr:T9SS type B sorting domain-containing protein [Hyunsoonleella ulvae]